MFTKSYAKLNLTLDVCGLRDDGYHEMVMVMQTVSLCDYITIEKTDDGNIFGRCNLEYIPSDDSNLAVKAAKVFMDKIGNTSDGLIITIDKKIPVGAGMAGGSSNASAVLRGLNDMYDRPLTAEELLSLSEKVGSDVAFCTLGGTALASGRGEKLQPLPDLPSCQILIAKPTFSISTPEFFKAIDKIKLKTHPDTNGMINALNAHDLDNVCRRMYNVFEDVPDRRLRVVPEIKRKFMDWGAKGTIMTGTGSAVFAVFDEGTDLSHAKSVLEREYGFCEIARPVKKLLH